MADNQTTIQLRAKRDELQDTIIYLDKKIIEARADLLHINAVLRLFELGPDTTQQFPAHVNLSRMFDGGELVALSLAALAERGASMTTREIADYVVRVKGWDEKDPVLKRGIAHRLVHTLTKARKRGRIASPGYQKGVRVWALPNSD